ncbi:MAG: amidohydrolase, partial [Fidelibacterota bacterium]
LTGILKDSAMDLVQKIIPETSQNKKLQALYEALKLANSYGVTGIHDISTFDDLDLYRIASEENRLTLRVYSITPLPLLDELLNRIKIRGKSQPFLHIGGVKGFVDGSLGSSTALFFEPYTDDPLNYGLLNSMMYPEGNMRRMILKADRAGIQAAVHAIGDKANNILLNIYEGIIEEEGERDRRFRIEHAQHLLPDDIPRFSRLGVIASMQPYHAIDDGRWAESRIGHRRSTTTYAFRSLLDNGALLSFGSDWSVAPLNPLTGIYAAVTRATTDGKSPGGWIPEEKITVEEALKAYTINAAYAEFAEHIKGSLEPGKLADIIILSEDIFDMAPERIPEIKVLMTIVNGKIVFRSEEFK